MNYRWMARMIRTAAKGCGLLVALPVLAGPGAWDPTFIPPKLGTVSVVAAQPDGRILVGGNFTLTTNNFFGTCLVRLFPNGAWDTSFRRSANAGVQVSGNVRLLVQQPDGSMVIGGEFGSVNGVSRNQLARIYANGDLDLSFAPASVPGGGLIQALAVQSDNKVIVSRLSGLSRYNTDGSLDLYFPVSVNGPVYAIGIQSDGKIIVAGNFSSLNGVNKNYIARLHPNGSLDASFTTGVNQTVHCLQVQPDDRILIGGNFTTVGGGNHYSIARLNSEGLPDPSFASAPIRLGSVSALAAQPDGKIVLINSSSPRLRRLHFNGSEDTQFLSAIIPTSNNALALQHDGAVLVGGPFTFDRTNQLSIARLYGDLYPPEFLLQPVSQNVSPGASVVFSALVNNPAPTYYQWRKNGVDIPGATGSTLLLNNVQAADAGSYSVFANNASGGISSSNAILNVGYPPVITAAPSDAIALVGQTVTFAVSATGTAPMYYWKKRGEFIPGATNAVLILPFVSVVDAGDYSCLVSNVFGQATSASATLTVYGAPVFTQQPESFAVGIGSNFTLQATAMGFPWPTYQWFKNGEAIPAANNSSYSIVAAQSADAGNYSVVATNFFGAATSAVAQIAVVAYPPVIVLQPVSQTVPEGQGFTLTVGAEGTAPLSYQWRLNGVDLPGATSSTYSVVAATASDGGSYSVRVSNGAGSEVSAPAVVAIAYPPRITQQPQSATNAPGGSASFFVAATGTTPLSYQWFKDDHPLPHATNALLELPALQPGDFGRYTVQVTNYFGSVTSAPAELLFADTLWQALAAYYPFNGDAKDASGHGYDGVVVDAVLTADRFAQPNSAYSFNGSNQHIDLPFGSNTFAGLTLSAWVRHTNYTQYSGIVGSRSASNNQIMLTISPDGAIAFNCTATGPEPRWCVAPAPITLDGEWHAVVATVDAATGTQRLFIDGALVAASENSPFTLQSTAPFKIGWDPLTGLRHFDGQIDDVRIYTRVLSADEVRDLYVLDVQAGFRLTAARTPNGIAVSFPGAANLSYSVLYTTDLTTDLWQKLINIPAHSTNRTVVVTDPAKPAPLRFYRVVTPSWP